MGLFLPSMTRPMRADAGKDARQARKDSAARIFLTRESFAAAPASI